MQTPSPHPLDIIIGHQLRLRRKMMGMSQVDIAKRCGITFQQIQKYENGKNSISARRLYELSQLLQVSPLYFYPPLQKGEMPLADVLTAQTIHLVKDYSAIQSAKVRDSIAAFVRQLAKEACRGL
jgi:transcriptional regulator with XRE-family HTH domain